MHRISDNKKAVTASHLGFIKSVSNAASVATSDIRVMDYVPQISKDLMKVVRQPLH